MKSTLTFIACLYYLSLFSQVCVPPIKEEILNSNALRVNILNASDFGRTNNKALYQPDYEEGTESPSTIHLGTVWYGGLDSDGKIRMGAGRYRNSISSPFYSGPLDSQTASTTLNDCSNWDVLFRVTASDIVAFLEDLSDGIIEYSHDAVLSWPAFGNPHFSSLMGFNLPDQQLASFHDANNDGVYNPMHGDYPVVQLQGLDAFVPNEQIWSIVNDEGGGATGVLSVPLEMHITYFVFHCPEKPMIHNAMFTSHKFINRSNITLDSFCIAHYVDFDLGCYIDDFAGSNPSTNSFYAYNSSNIDQESNLCNGTLSYGINPPVQAVTFLNKSLDGFMPIFNPGIDGMLPVSDPRSPIEYFRYLHGFWRDGLPLTSGGSGYDPSLSGPGATHAFPGNPNIGTEWSMLSAGVSKNDMRGLGIHRVGTYSPGQILELNTAFTYHRGPGLNHLENVNLMLEEVPHLAVLYANNFTDVCTSSVSVNEPGSQPELKMWPNPVNKNLQLQMSEAGLKTVRVFDISGRLMTSKIWDDIGTLHLDTETWPAGTYILHITTKSRIVTRKVIVL